MKKPNERNGANPCVPTMLAMMPKTASGTKVITQWRMRTRQASSNSTRSPGVATLRSRSWRRASPKASARMITPSTLPSSVSGPSTLRGTLSRKVVSGSALGRTSTAGSGGRSSAPAPGRRRFATRSPMVMATRVLRSKSPTRRRLTPLPNCALMRAWTMAHRIKGRASAPSRRSTSCPGSIKPAASGPSQTPTMTPRTSATTICTYNGAPSVRATTARAPLAIGPKRNAAALSPSLCGTVTASHPSGRAHTRRILRNAPSSSPPA